MVIYQVQLTIESSIFNDFAHWLKQHVDEMLQFAGFTSGKILSHASPNEQEDVKILTVQYEVISHQYLEDYLNCHADNMRQKGLEAFGNRFSAKREIFTVL